MLLTFAEDFTSDINLDSELLGVSESKYYYNRGVHPSVTVDNLLTFLPKKDITIADYNAGTTYGVFTETRKRSDLTVYQNTIYQSIADNNTGNTPGPSSNFWLATDLNSLRIKSFIFSTEDNALSALSLSRKLIENQYIYNLKREPAPVLRTADADFFGWVFEPKGSDYVKIRINQIAFQANTDQAQNLYVVNQGQLIDTLTLNPDNGVLSFEDVGYTISGKGEFLLITQAQEVYTNDAYNDPLKYSGFVAYPVTGKGSTPEGSTYSFATSANGLSFNVSCYLDSEIYVKNNKIDLAGFYRTQFEYDAIRMMLHGSNNRFNIEERQQKANPELMATESLDLSGNTIARKYNSHKKEAIQSINRTFDKFIKAKRTGLRVKLKTV